MDRIGSLSWVGLLAVLIAAGQGASAGIVPGVRQIVAPGAFAATPSGPQERGFLVADEEQVPVEEETEPEDVPAAEEAQGNTEATAPAVQPAPPVEGPPPAEPEPEVQQPPLEP
jgi:hypothetical protein